MPPPGHDELADPPYHPFVSYEFLSALELSGCVGPGTGWQPQFGVLRAADGTVQAVVPMYAKGHSQGEYVFDHVWADAFERAGGRYYPKLQVSVPFTPATGPRLLVRQRSTPEEQRMSRLACIQALEQVATQSGISSIHATFLAPSEVILFEEADWLVRTDQQFHWFNADFGDYDDFLATLSSRKRKALKKERREATVSGVEIVWRRGAEITEAYWDAFYDFYMDTGARKWGQPYLNRQFFSLIGQSMPDDLLLIVAERDGHPIAGALNFISPDALYGRYWGCVEDHRYLHFELCYHQAIDFAIANHIPRVEAGAQGAHKLARGYKPTLTYSAHYITHPGFRGAIEDYLVQERQAVDHEQQAMSRHLPFRRDDD
jgi:hypothetical protein